MTDETVRPVRPRVKPGASVVQECHSGSCDSPAGRIQFVFVPSGNRNIPPAKYTYPISFRLRDDQVPAAEALRCTFDPPSWGEAFRWLFDSPEGQSLLQKRMKGTAS